LGPGADPVRRVADLRVGLAGSRPHRAAGRVEVELPVSRPRQRPLALRAELSYVEAVPDLQPHPGPLQDVCLDPLQAAVEEPSLPVDALRLVEVLPLLPAVDLEPLVAGAQAAEGLQ